MLPDVLLGYQKRWVSDDSPVAICEKSRRVGITWASSAQAVLTAAAHDGMDVFYVGISREMASEFIRDAADWARDLHLAASAIDEDLFPGGDDGTKSIFGFKISFASGFRVIALSSRPSNIRGRQGMIIGDELAWHPDMPGLIKAAMAMLVWGGRVRLISTHHGIDSEFNQLIQAARAGKNPYRVHRVTLHDALADGLYRRICTVSGQVWTPEAEQQWVDDLYAFYGDDAAEELDVIPSSDSTSYLSHQCIDQCMADGLPVLRLSVPREFIERSEIERQMFVDAWVQTEAEPYLSALPPHLKHFCGQDFARSGDVSALVVMTELETLRYRVPLVLEMRQVPFDNQRQVVFQVLSRLPHFTRGAFDSGGNGSYLAEQAQVRFPGRGEGVTFSEKWYREHMPRLKDWLEQKRLTIPRHADILRDLRAIELIRGVPKVDPAKRQVGTDGKPRHADSAVALALAVYAASGALEPAATGLAQATGRSAYRSDRGRRRWPV